MELVTQTFDRALVDVTCHDVTELTNGELHRGLLELLEAKTCLEAMIAKVANEWTERGV